jgi:glycosyltransferase involved in cell wall biosynthesis
VTSRPARVCLLGPDPANEGGMPAVVRDLLSSPLAEEFDLDVLPTYRPNDVAATVRAFPGVLARLAGFCLGSGPRLVHVHSAVRGSLYRKSVCTLLVRALRRPVLVHVHAGADDIDEFVARLGPVRRRAFAVALRRADRVLSVSRAGGERLTRHFGLRGVTVVPNAAPRVEPGPPPGEAGARILYLGGFEDPAKGGASLVAALPEMRERAPEADVVLAGPGEPTADEAAALRGAGARWAGWLGPEDKRDAFVRAAVVVFPSLSEGLPVALLEAMAHGRAIVATRVGGMPEVLTDGADARLVPPGDGDALAGAVASLLADPVERDRLGAAARERAERLNADEVAGRLGALYRGLLGGPRGRGR